MDKPRTEAEQLEDAVAKCKKMRDVCNNTVSELQLVLKDVKGTKFWSKAAQRDAEYLLQDIMDASTQIQKVLLKKSSNFEALQEVCLMAATKVKSTAQEMKEYKALLHKTCSRASKSGP